MRTITLNGEEYEFKELATLGESNREEVTFGHALTPDGPLACIVYEISNIIFYAADDGMPQPATVAEIGEHEWYSEAGTQAIMFPYADGLRLPLLPPWAAR